MDFIEPMHQPNSFLAKIRLSDSSGTKVVTLPSQFSSIEKLEVGDYVKVWVKKLQKKED